MNQIDDEDKDHEDGSNELDEDMRSPILQTGHGPGPRVGHAATSVCNRFMHIHKYSEDPVDLNTAPMSSCQTPTHLSKL